VPHLCEDVEVAAAVGALVDLDDAVHDGDVPAVEVEHHNLAGARGRLAEVQE
jgi:hypothetical protein